MERDRIMGVGDTGGPVLAFLLKKYSSKHYSKNAYTGNNLQHSVLRSPDFTFKIRFDPID